MGSLRCPTISPYLMKTNNPTSLEHALSFVDNDQRWKEEITNFQLCSPWLVEYIYLPLCVHQIENVNKHYLNGYTSPSVPSTLMVLSFQWITWKTRDKGCPCARLHSDAQVKLRAMKHWKNINSESSVCVFTLELRTLSCWLLPFIYYLVFMPLSLTVT